MSIVPVMLISMVVFYAGLAAFLLVRILARSWRRHRSTDRRMFRPTPRTTH